MKKLITKIKSVLSTEKNSVVYIRNENGIFDITSDGHFFSITLTHATNSENGMYITDTKQLKKIICEDLFENIHNYLTANNDGLSVFDAVKDHFYGYNVQESTKIAYNEFKSGYTGLFNEIRSLCNYMYFDNNQLLSSNGHYLTIKDIEANNVDFMLDRKICDALFKLKSDFTVNKGHLFDDTLVTVSTECDGARFDFYNKYASKNYEEYIRSFRNSDIQRESDTITVNKKELQEIIKDFKTMNINSGIHLVKNDKKLVISNLKCVRGDEYQDLDIHQIDIISENHNYYNKFDLMINKDLLLSVIKNQESDHVELKAVFVNNWKGESYCNSLHVFCNGFKAKIMVIIA